MSSVFGMNAIELGSSDRFSLTRKVLYIALSVIVSQSAFIDLYAG